MDEAKYKRNEAENEKLLKEFEQYLRSKDLSDKTINNHIRNIKLVKNSLNCISQEFPVKKMAIKGLIMRNSVQWFCFLLKKTSELLKTKLMKLLCYSDMIFYKENGVSISGVKYAHLPYGPAPDHFDIILGKMAADHVAHIEVFYDGIYEKHQVIPERDFLEDVLTETETEVLNRIFEKFKNFGSVEISNYSHNEKGYNETKAGEIISYTYAMDIELN